MTSVKRPRCEKCATVMHSLAVNEYNGNTNEALRVGWLCKKCLNVVLEVVE